MRTNARVLLATMVALVVALPRAATARTDLPDGTGGDHPLTRSFVLYGRIDAFVTGLAHNSLPNPYGTFTVSGLPQGASVKKALLYLTDWRLAGPVSGTFGSGSFGPAGPISADPSGDLTPVTYRFDVTTFVTGNGDYPFTSQGIAQSYGSALVVVYGNSGLSVKTIEINDGVESMCCDVSSLTRLFPGGPGGAAGRLIIFTTADNASESGEKIGVNGVVVGGPIDANLGPYASLFDIPVHYQERHNAAVIYTPADYFAWHLAVQVVGHP